MTTRRHQKCYVLQGCVISPDGEAGPILDIPRVLHFFLAMVRSIQVRGHGRYSTCQAKLLGGHLSDDVLPEASSVLKPSTLGKGVFEPATLLPSSQGIKSEYNTLASATFSISCKFINEQISSGFFGQVAERWLLTSKTTTHRLPSFSIKNRESVLVDNSCTNTGSCKLTSLDKCIPRKGSLNMNPTGRAWIVMSLHSRYALENREESPLDDEFGSHKR